MSVVLVPPTLMDHCSLRLLKPRNSANNNDEGIRRVRRGTPSSRAPPPALVLLLLVVLVLSSSPAATTTTTTTTYPSLTVTAFAFLAPPVRKQQTLFSRSRSSLSFSRTDGASLSTSSSSSCTEKTMMRSPFLLRSTSAPLVEAASLSSNNDDSSSDNNSNINLSNSGNDDGFPELGEDGVYHIMDRQQHAKFLQANADKLVVVKVYAPWCRACAGLAPKFLQIRHNPLYENLPLVWADLSVQHNKNFVKELGVLALPSIQFYVGKKLTENFPCGPSKVPILKRKLAQLINAHVDATTRLVKPTSLLTSSSETAVIAENGTVETGSSSYFQTTQETANGTGVFVERFVAGTTFNDTSVLDAASARAETSSAAKTTKTSITPTSWKPASLSEVEKQKLVSQISFMQDLSLADLDDVLSKAKVFTLDAGSIIMREGRMGRTFYIIVDGEVEICQRTQYNDPLVTTSDSYLGSVINRFGPGDYFGERALITGEPRAASIRAAETTTCLVFDRDDFPASSVLSGRTRNKELLENVDDRYGVQLGDLLQLQVTQQIIDASTASQVRGSVNSPRPIRGVDTEEDYLDSMIVPEEEEEEDERKLTAVTAAPAVSKKSTVVAPANATIASRSSASAPASFTMADKDVVSLLTRFQMIRQVSLCLKYMEQTRVQWGDEGIRLRRGMLVSRLPVHQQRQFRDTFHLIDAAGNGKITLLDLKRVMETIGETKSDEELLGIFTASGGNSKTKKDLEQVLTEVDFMGIMAEAEFYHLFRDIFNQLDTYDAGFVRARDLDRVLCGVRDLISDDRKSIIDVEDDEMQIDYEQFSRMLLGSALA